MGTYMDMVSRTDGGAVSGCMARAGGMHLGHANVVAGCLSIVTNDTRCLWTRSAAREHIRHLRHVKEEVARQIAEIHVHRRKRIAQRVDVVQRRVDARRL